MAIVSLKTKRAFGPCIIKSHFYKIEMLILVFRHKINNLYYHNVHLYTAFAFIDYILKNLKGKTVCMFATHTYCFEFLFLLGSLVA